MTSTLTQQFAAQYARGVVPAMLKAISAAKRDTRLIVAGVLGITFPHQAMWLTTIHGIGVLGWVIPLVVDLAMLRMLGIVQTTGMRRPAKVAALAMTGLLGAMSAGVNVAAPAAVAARVIFGALVLVAVGVKIVTSLVGPDFAAIEATETAVAVAPTVDPAVDEARARRSAAAKQAAATRKANAERAAAAKADAAQARRERREALRDEQRASQAGLFSAIAAEMDPSYVETVAPVSPAVA